MVTLVRDTAKEYVLPATKLPDFNTKLGEVADEAKAVDCGVMSILPLVQIQVNLYDMGVALTGLITADS